MSLSKKLKIGLSTTFTVAILLSIVQIKVIPPMLLAERFHDGFGWIQITLMSVLGAWLAVKMTDKSESAKWRTYSWTFFSIVFFAQLILGLAGFDAFLMTGKMHLPIPAVIPGGAIYRMEFSFMPILFLSTVFLTGPAWCSHLCYLGALDNLTSGIKSKSRKIVTKNLRLVKTASLMVFISAVVLLRACGVPVNTAATIAIIFGIIGLAIIVFSSFVGKMTHCIYFCPLGTILNYSRFINPFKMFIDDSCTNCMKCSKSCKYLALEKQNIEIRKPGFTCTMCGDCINSCNEGSIKYKLWNFSPDAARNIYIVITVVVYIVFLNVARI
jgi:polyferredoxin